MIHYDNTSWIGLVFRFSGTVWERIWHIVLLIVAICGVFYAYEVVEGHGFGSTGHTILGSTMSFLLVFRASAASDRYWQGKTLVSQTFSGLRQMIMMMCVSMKGGKACEAWRDRRASCEDDANDIKASMARVNCVRLVLAYAVALKLHMRIAHDGYVRGVIDAHQKRMVDIDRIRLRGLLTRQEFELVNSMIPIFNDGGVAQGAKQLTPAMIEEVLERPQSSFYEVDIVPDMRQPLAILMLLRLEIVKHMNELYGLRDRYAKDMMGICDTMSSLFENITTQITTPIPFPYAHLCRLMLVCYLASTPLVLNPKQGWFGCVCMPGFVALSLLGIDAIAVELAEPFGDDKNDLDITSSIMALEDECAKFLDLCGDTRSLEAFRSYEILEGMELDDPRTPCEFFCLCSQVVSPRGRQGTGGSDLEDVGREDSEDAIVVLRPKMTTFLRAARARPAPRPASTSAARAAPRPPEHEEFEEDDPREPLLSANRDEANASSRFRPMGSNLGSSSQAIFRPLDEIPSGAETIQFEEAQDVADRRGPDCIGLSDDEAEEDPSRDVGVSLAAGSMDSIRASGAFQPMSGELRGSASPRSSARSRERRLAKKGLRSKEGSMVGSARSRGRAADGGEEPFMPMEEMGTQTMHFSDIDLGGLDGPDVVGLSDDEEDDDGGGRAE